MQRAPRLTVQGTPRLPSCWLPHPASTFALEHGPIRLRQGERQMKIVRSSRTASMQDESSRSLRPNCRAVDDRSGARVRARKHAAGWLDRAGSGPVRRLRIRSYRQLQLIETGRSTEQCNVPDDPCPTSIRQFISNGGYSRNTLAAVTRMCCVTVRGGSFSPVSRRRASGSTS
jgi:hypothetical protein